MKTIKTNQKCPKCGKPLDLITSRGHVWLGHVFSLEQIDAGKCCDYNRKEKVDE